MGSYIKKTIREQAVQIGLPFIHKESQDLCFTRDFNEFYRNFTQHPITMGSFITPTGDRRFQHKGQQFYTRGQKVGIGHDVFYIDRKLPNGDMLVCHRERLYQTQIHIDHVNFIVSPEDLDPVKTYQVKIIYRAIPVNCHLDNWSVDGTITIITHACVYAPTKGQIATLYDDERVIMGGSITL
jgi:tRNA U34 2-thiouridine synthase MnmA/TrmU